MAQRPEGKSIFIIGSLLALSLFFLNSKSQAASTSTGAVSISASIPSGITLNVTILDQLTQTAKPTLDFGELVRVGNEFRSETFFKVLVEVDTVGSSFHLVQVGTPLVRNGGSETMPSGAYIVEPIYQDTQNDGKPQPTGSTIGKRQSVVGTQELYTDPTGSKRVLTAIYHLSGDPITGGKEIIPLDQKSGSYSGTIQYTLTSE